MMSQLTLNSIPSLDGIQRQARTKDRHVKYHALDTSTCGTFTPGTIWTSFHANVVHPTDAATIRIWVTRLILLDVKEYDVRIATNPSSRTTACSYRTRSASSDTLREQSSRPTLVGTKPTLASFCTAATINYKKAIYRNVHDLTSVILEALTTRTHTQARITWQPAAFFTRCIQRKTQPEKRMTIKDKTWVTCKPTSTAFSVN